MLRDIINKKRLDYLDTFYPVAKMVTVKSVTGVAVSYNCPIFQMNVPNVFLQGDLTEEVHMELP